MWLIQGIRSGSLLFFSRVNPIIETGGFFSEEKWPIYQLFPEEYIPKTIFISARETWEVVQENRSENKMDFPLLVKPNIGERGMGVQKILDAAALQGYHKRASYDYLIQSFVPYHEEMSILAYRLPGNAHVTVTSICLKEKLTITGDGVSTIDTLATSNYRASTQWERLAQNFDKNRVLKKGEKLLLEPIGNHSRGTTFLDGNDLLDESFRLATEKIFSSISPDIQYGRFDLLYHSIDEFKKGNKFKIVEFNGVGSEPAHIYQPNYSLFKAYADLWRHACILGKISRLQRKQGVKAMSWSEFFNALRLYRTNMEKVKGIEG